jgi:hypothetical protein
MTRASLTAARLADHVDRLALEHPPIDLDSVDYTVRRPAELGRRFGHVLDYMARVELEVERNVLELTTLLPSPTSRPSAPRCGSLARSRTSAPSRTSAGCSTT